MSATEKSLRSGLALLCLGFAFGLSMPLRAASTGAGVSLQSSGEGSERPSLVRVEARSRISGLLHENRLISQSTVLQISDFTGVVLDVKGYVAAYVGSSWAQAQGLEPRFAVHFPRGRKTEAKLVGVDERVSVAILKLRESWSDPIVMAPVRRAGNAYLHSAVEGSWKDVRIDVAHVRTTELESEIELQARVSTTPSAGLPGIGNVALDRSGRFLGFVSQVGPESAGHTLRSLRILPATRVRESLEEVVVRGGNIEAGWLGIFMDPSSSKVRVTRVVPESPAEEAGLEEGDLILKVGAANIWSKSQFVKQVRWAGPGEELEFTVERGGRAIRLPVQLSRLPETRRTGFAWAIKVPRVIGRVGSESRESREKESISEREFEVTLVPVDSSLDLGFSVYPLTPQLADHFQSPTGRGLLVKSVLEGSPAAGFGFEAGDILLRINEQTLHSTDDLSESLSIRKDGVLEIEWLRDGQIRSRRLILH